ncbi:hypothetical protein ABW636_14210 [Aquimarina sp. 2201CG1-2-11]|uniref:hypothetical protein n=1 Tax=Aquimarina discodermiae TaxID=3231043 RepID=UPI00346237D0
MKSNQEILDEFGKLLVNNVFDQNYRMINNSVETFENTDGYKNLFKGMNSIQKKEIEGLVYALLENMLFEFLKVFEEYDQFKIYFEENSQKINLVEISEMLKAEPVIENGWIARFSREVNK